MPWIRDSYGDLTERRIPDIGLEPDIYDRPPRLFCDICGEGIYDGEEYYDINGDITLCENCMNEARRYAGVDYD